MRYGSLSDHFTGIVAKRLSAVEADTDRSNQHEFNGTGQLRQLLGGDRLDRMMARFIWLGGENEGITDDAPVTWYDARERNPTRSEWRLYFQSNAVTEAASAGDLLVVARRPGGDLMFIVAPNGSTLENQIAWLFGLDHGLGAGFRYEEFEGEGDRGLDFVSNYVLEEIGIEPEEPDAHQLDEIIARVRDAVSYLTRVLIPRARFHRSRRSARRRRRGAAGMDRIRGSDVPPPRAAHSCGPP